MRKLGIILGLVGLFLILRLGWQVASYELIEIEFQEDLHDLAAQVGTHIGLPEASTDEELRSAVTEYAKKYGIHLDPDQITVERSGTPEAPMLYLAARYQEVIKLPGYPFTLKFSASSRN